MIEDRLKSDFDLLTSMGYEVLGIFLQGSQNYNLAYEGSDIDTKAIVVPSFEDFILNKKAASTTHVLPNNEHIDIKDIRLMHDCFRKQNINFIEILFTKYKYMNPEYEDFYKYLYAAREAVAHYNNYAAVNCIAGMVFEKHKALEHPYPATIDKIEKYGFDPKQLHHMLRCEEFLNRYINGVPYEQCLIPTNPEYLIKVKADCPYSLEEARELANDLDAKVKKIKDDYMANNPLFIINEIEDLMNEVLVNVCKYKFKKDIMG